MKLKKLLLPIAGVASTAAIVAPIVTSCGIGGYTITGDKIYIPKSAQAEWDIATHPEGYSIKDATNLYFNDLAENAKIFEEDIVTYWSAYMYMVKLEYEAATQGLMDFDVKIKAKYSNVTVNTEQDQSKTLSFKVTGSFKINISLNKTNDNDDGQIDNIKSFSMELSHIPYELSSSAHTYDWSFAVENDYAALPDSASVKGKADGYFISEDGIVVCDNKEFVIDKDHSVEHLTWSQIAFMDVAYSMFCSVRSSYHMANIYSSGK